MGWGWLHHHPCRAIICWPSHTPHLLNLTNSLHHIFCRLDLQLSQVEASLRSEDGSLTRELLATSCVSSSGGWRIPAALPSLQEAAAMPSQQAAEAGAQPCSSTTPEEQEEGGQQAGASSRAGGRGELGGGSSGQGLNSSLAAASAVKAPPSEAPPAVTVAARSPAKEG